MSTTNKPIPPNTPIPNAFRPFRFDSDEDLRCMLKWDNDPQLNHLIIPAFTQEQRAHQTTLDELKKSFLQKGDPRSAHFMLELGGQPVGQVSCQFGMRHLFTKGDDIAWFGIVIGEESARGKGLGKISLKFLEDYAKSVGSRQAEAGVFEYNLISQKLFLGAGYNEITRVQDFTYWNGRKWADIRYLKDL